MKMLGGVVSSQIQWLRPLAQLQKCILALFILVAALATGAAADPAPEVVQAIFQRVNDFRAQRGLPPLQMNAKLQQSAQAYAELLAQASPDTTGPAAGVPDQQCMGGAPHIHCWDGTTPAQRAQNAGFSCPQQVAENEAGSWSQPTLLPAEAVENAIVGWTTEVPPNDGHLRNILSDATLTGVGAAIVTMGGRQFILIVQDFSRPCPGETGTTTPPPTPPTTPPPTPPTTPPPAEQPNLVIDKQAGPCALGPGDTVQCPFTITVTNIGQGDFNGPLDISEDVGFDRANLDFSPPFVCTPTGGGTGAADCRLDNATIPAGGNTTLTLTTNIAHGDVASAPCQLVNRATLNLGGAGPNPEAATQADISGVAPTCDGGAGQAPGPGGVCPPGTTVTPPNCGCPAGPQWNGQQCVPTTQTPPVCYGGAYCNGQQCVCRPGSQWNGQQCVPATQTPPVCYGGQYWNGQICVCRPASQWNGQQCVPTTQTPPVCYGGQYWNGQICVCRPASQWNGQQCVPTTQTPPVCYGGQYWNGQICVCRPASQWNGQQCVPTTQTPPVCYGG